MKEWVRGSVIGDHMGMAAGIKSSVTKHQSARVHGRIEVACLHALAEQRRCGGIGPIIAPFCSPIYPTLFQSRHPQHVDAVYFRYQYTSLRIAQGRDKGSLVALIGTQNTSFLTAW